MDLLAVHIAKLAVIVYNGIKRTDWKAEEERD